MQFVYERGPFFYDSSQGAENENSKSRDYEHENQNVNKSNTQKHVKKQIYTSLNTFQQVWTNQINIAFGYFT